MAIRVTERCYQTPRIATLARTTATKALFRVDVDVAADHFLVLFCVCFYFSFVKFFPRDVFSLHFFASFVFGLDYDSGGYNVS